MLLSEELGRASLIAESDELGAELVARVDALLSSFSYDSAEEFARWFRKRFSGVMAPRTPSQYKKLKMNVEWFLKKIDTSIEFSKHNSSDDFRVARAREVESAWSLIRDNVTEMIAAFARDETREIPTEITVGQNTYVNKVGLSAKDLRKYADAIEKLLATLKGWRARALGGGLRVVFAGPKEFRGTASGVYKSMEDALYVRTTPAVLKRTSAAYGGFDYILIHEVGHRYQFKVRVSTDFDKVEWYTTRYSMTEGETFAELFALGHFGITSSPGRTWSPDVQERFETIMSSGG